MTIGHDERDQNATISLDEFPYARDGIDEETGLPVGPAIDDAMRAIMDDRRIGGHRLGGGLMTLDMETVDLRRASDMTIEGTVYDRTFEETRVGASRNRPIRIAASNDQWIAISAALADQDLNLQREVEIPEDGRALIRITIETPRDLRTLETLVAAFNPLDMSGTDIVISVEQPGDGIGIDRRHAFVMLGADQHDRSPGMMFHRYGDPTDVLSMALQNILPHDHHEDMVQEMQGLGLMLDMELRHARKRSIYRMDHRNERMHHVASALLPERKGFDHRVANAAPRSARGQRGKRR